MGEKMKNDTLSLLKQKFEMNEHTHKTDSRAKMTTENGKWVGICHIYHSPASATETSMLSDVEQHNSSPNAMGISLSTQVD